MISQGLVLLGLDYEVAACTAKMSNQQVFIECTTLGEINHFSSYWFLSTARYGSAYLVASS